MREYSIYKKKSGNFHLSEAVTEAIKIYCLSLMVNSNDAYAWNIGLTADEIFTTGTNFKRWICQNHIEALHTQAYFIGKGMVNLSLNPGGNEYIIYICR